MATQDHLFNLHNNFYLSAYQATINSNDVSNLSQDDAVKRNSFVHRYNISLGQLYALNVQIFIKMHRSDYAERQLQIIQLIDEDNTLTQLANM
ncbi:Coatomer subunit epsilon-1 [Spatholobus suberectus]|nr:Coatomer subunit epsilon-1 [Spatholobus suberectus]